jgi:murein L,D-transpeptidase YafK
MLRRCSPALSLLAAVLLAAQPGCVARVEHWGLGSWLARSDSKRPGPALPNVPVVDPDSTELPWAREEQYFIVVRRSCQRLDLFHWGQIVRRYPAVFGINSRGGKLFEGDLRTPTGFYTIVDKRRHPRWARFLLIDYPNSTDARRYMTALEAGSLPQRGDELAGIGGAIGIHGSDKEALNERGEDWTLGCISLTNDDVRELDALVPVGTPVLIQE